MRPKDSRPVWGEGAGKVPDSNSPTPYSTARTDLCGGCWATSIPTATVGDLADEYGFNDIDGRRIPPFRMPEET